MSRPMSPAEAARIVGLSESQVRGLLRAALRKPSPRPSSRQDSRPSSRQERTAVTFQDLVTLRAARALLEGGVPVARIGRALRALAARTDCPIAGLRLFAVGGRVAADDGEERWDAETGQLLLDLGSRVDAGREPSDLRPPRPARARLVFERALSQEACDWALARASYERALALDPDLVPAFVNLGRLWHLSGDARRAATLYREALRRAPFDPIVHYDLAIALEDTSEVASALAHYRRALSLDPDLGPAHYNLARLCECMGRSAEALAHYRAYRALRGGSTEP